MAKSNPLDDHSLNSSEDECDGVTEEAETRKQNGIVDREIDRYGFLGGAQYTEPKE